MNLFTIRGQDCPFHDNILHYYSYFTIIKKNFYSKSHQTRLRQKNNKIESSSYLVQKNFRLLPGASSSKKFPIINEVMRTINNNYFFTRTLHGQRVVMTASDSAGYPFPLVKFFFQPSLLIDSRTRNTSSRIEGRTKKKKDRHTRSPEQWEVDSCNGRRYNLRVASS